MAPTNETKNIANQIKTNLGNIVAGTNYNFSITTATREWKNFRDWKFSELPSVIVQSIGTERFIYSALKRVVQSLPIIVYGTIEKRDSALLEDDLELFKADLQYAIHNDPSLSSCISPAGRVFDVKITGISRAIGETDMNVKHLATRPRGLLVMTLDVQFTGALVLTR